MDSDPLLSPEAETRGTSKTSKVASFSPDRNENWIVAVNGSLECMPSNEQRKNPSIYRVPAFITNLNPEAHRPQVISFGPYHHDNDSLRPMEKHKHRALHHFLQRSRKSHATFLESLREVGRDLEESYSTLDPGCKEEGTGDKFLELMLRDGCFMLEIMRTLTGDKCDYAPYDPIFGIHGLRYIEPYIKRDMLILENQLPMLVLYQLVAVENNGKERDEYVNKLILKFHSVDACITGMGRFLHVIDVFRKGLLEPKKVQHEQEIEVSEAGDKIIRSATELNEAGIRFKKSETSGLKDISFARGVLRLPTITVDDTTESMFLNLMTFERLHIGAGNEITSYINFMDNIINNEQDVALLHTQGIIQNAMGSNKVVAKLFNSLCKEVTVASNSSLDKVQKHISIYCRKPWNKWRATLNHTYFGNPWAILSLLAAVFLFALTIIQTVYALLSYY